MKSYCALLPVGVALAFCSVIYAATIHVPSDQSTIPNSSTAIQQMNQMPLAFTKNMGQWDDRVLFRANSGGATMWFTKEGITYQFTRRIDRSGAVSVPGLANAVRSYDTADRFSQEEDLVEQMILTAKFVGSNPNPEIIAEGQMEYKCNYFLGNDPTKWHADVPNYEAITLKDIYPGIDLKYSGDGAGQAAYEFVAAPGADIAQIKVAYEGAEETSIDADGRMIVRTKWGDMIAAIKIPTSGTLSGMASFSQVSEKTIGFESSGSSRQALGTLTVELVYSTYLGGGAEDNGLGIAVDGSGNAYVTGSTASPNFPTLNPYQPTFQGGFSGGGDVFVAKLSSFGNSLIYSTFLGGESNDLGNGIAVDGIGDAYVTGYTYSSNFPTLNPYQATFQGGSCVAFVTKLSSTGNSLIYSTFLGGGDFDRGFSIAVDGNGNAYVTGLTASFNFPTQNPYQATHQGGYGDAFVTKLSSTGNSLIYSTYLGGGDHDFGDGIAVDSIGNAYVAGWTSSSDFPVLNPYQTYQGSWDAFVTKLSSSGSSLIYSTYLGGGDNDWVYGIAVDGSGNAYVTGQTSSYNFPTLNPYQPTFHGISDAFVTKLTSSGTNLMYSTYLGGGKDDYGLGIAVDDSGNVYVTGWTESSEFPTLNAYETDQGSTDAFVTKLSGHQVNRPPTINPLSDITQQEGDTVSFQVTATDPDSTILFLIATGLPTGATFVDSGNGTGKYYWIISPKQYGMFSISFIASDSVLADTETVAIQVLARLPLIADLSVEGSQTPEHVTAHVPKITWRYVDFANDDPQLKFETAVGTDSDWTYSEMWNPAPFNSSDTFVVYNGSPLVDGTTYWLRLRVNNNLGWSGWRHMSIRMNSIPTIPQLRLPLAAGIVLSQQPGLIIRNSTDTEGDSLLYTFEVSPDSFATAVFTFTKKQDADSLTTLIVDSTLVENGQYWWCVKVSDYYESSDFSLIRSFYVNATNTAPTAFALSSPDSGLTTPVTTLLPQFTWVSSSDPDPLDSVRYTIFIALDQHFNFTKQITDLTTTSYTLTDSLTWGTHYWWKVKANDLNGGSTWSTRVFTFRTMTLGDADGDGSVTIADVVFLINYIFMGGAAPQPVSLGDADCSGSINIADAVYLISYIFSHGLPPCMLSSNEPMGTYR